MSSPKPVAWHYKPAYWLFGVALLIMAGRTAGGAVSWVWHSLWSEDAPITTVYTTEQHKPSPDYYWPS
ncbi:hypothetical protein VXE65_19160 [Mycolicibacterium conceptionense]|uniref:hypothetical protein n=1 Tax=Mycolicibacterium conceptionense TaxID=451644 RepID=UPI003204A608